MIMQQPIEVHLVNPGAVEQIKGANILYDVKQHSVFLIDDLTKEIINSCQGCSDEEVSSRLGHYQKVEVDKALAELGSMLDRSSNPEPIWYRPLTTIKLHIYHGCNLRCRYCYGWKDSDESMYGGSESTMMSEETALKAIDCLFSASQDEHRVMVTFHGGEPMLNLPLIKKVVEYARTQKRSYKKDIQFSICTNGIIYTEEMARFFAINNVSVVISLDGDESGNEARIFPDGTSSYKTTTENIHRYLRSGCSVSAQVTVHHKNTDLARAVKFLREIGISSVLLNLNRLYDTENEYALTDLDTWNLMRQFDKLLQLEVENNVFGKSRTFFVSNLGRIYNSLEKGYRIWNYCSMGMDAVSIAPDGAMYTCEWFINDKEQCLGNVSDGKSGYGRDFLRQLLVDQRELCRDCWARHLCGGPCLYESQQRCGTIAKTPNHLCELNRSIADSILAIYAYWHMNLLDNANGH